jgi:hypothetical protein
MGGERLHVAERFDPDAAQARPLPADVLVLALLFFLDMGISSSVATASGAATTEAPRRPPALAGYRRSEETISPSKSD